MKFALALLCALLAGCAASSAASEPPSPAASTANATAPATATPTTTGASDPVAEVQAPLLASGITVVDAQETTSSTAYFSCGPGLPLRTFAFYEEAPHATFRPGEKPQIDALVFASPADRRAYQRQISSDGTTLKGPHCSAIIDWVATPHWVGGGRYLLLVVSNDATLATQVAAAAGRLGSP